ncbi:FKBP-type peptidyl-prolyl cis-trans isomerase [Thalassotalea sp. LPB0316]|uniref:FKBP-type peptidyl-prolyl cis-trans isomerase n=1 Tax=Thalassotalea sp. LPB0316 TaxID=2769490 RepID=UPI001866CA6B|nr:FKBP-type peptidyl-prolyl cis-trans isomerase [Thalassotalea sp. LPB0316]QOL24653.1 FKBP-type peptidyl-prolyl cis-trans isomerase [Thalassotalea sp. LPB0316]
MKYIVIMLVVALMVFMYQRAGKNKALAVENKQIGEAFLTTNKQQEGVVETQSGLQYLVLNKGDSTIQPSANSTVNVHYHGTLIDGTVFDSSVERGSPISFGLKQVIAGWTEGLQTMHVGDKTRFFIPAELAYGDRAVGKIPAGSTLIFDVELLAVQ